MLLYMHMLVYFVSNLQHRNEALWPEKWRVLVLTPVFCHQQVYMVMIDLDEANTDAYKNMLRESMTHFEKALSIDTENLVIKSFLNVVSILTLVHWPDKR